MVLGAFRSRACCLMKARVIEFSCTKGQQIQFTSCMPGSFLAHSNCCQDITVIPLNSYTATSLVPPPDEILLVGVNEPVAALMNPRALWWLPHLAIGIHRLSPYPKLSGNGGHIDLFCCQILDLVVQLYSMLIKL